MSVTQVTNLNGVAALLETGVVDTELDLLTRFLRHQQPVTVGVGRVVVGVVGSGQMHDIIFTHVDSVTASLWIEVVLNCV